VGGITSSRAALSLREHVEGPNPSGPLLGGDTRLYQLGLNLSHDASVALGREGSLILATEEERLTRVKHNSCESELVRPYSSIYYPRHSIERMFVEVGIGPRDIDTVAFSTSAEFVDGSLATADEGVFDLIAKQFLHDFTSAHIEKNSHHFSHFWSARCMSEARRVVGLVVDGSGNALNPYPDLRSFWERSSVFMDDEGVTTRIQLVLPFHYYSPRLRAVVRSTNSIGEFFRRIAVAVIPAGNEPEGTMMALSASGDPDRYYSYIMGFVSLGKNGHYQIHEHEFIDSDPAKSWDEQEYAFVSPEGKLIDHRTAELGELADIASAAQKSFETIMLHLVAYAADVARDDDIPIACAGGAFLNCVLNERVLRGLYPRKVLLQPASHDGGIALGCVASASSSAGYGHSLNVPEPPFLGFRPRPAETGQRLVRAQPTSQSYIAAASSLLQDGGVIGICVGPAEFGPRALGHRSILADGSKPGTAKRLNEIKQRAEYRPFACSILVGAWSSYFDSPVDSLSMMRAIACRPEKRHLLGDLVHTDGTCRIQVVDESTEPLFSILRAFERATALPFLLNTSLNLKGKPIAQDNTDAIACFETLGLDALFLESGFIVRERRHGID
jgi:carbamoyltransferase